MNFTKTLLLSAKKTLVLSLTWAMASSLPVAAQTPSTQSSSNALSRSPIIFSAPPDMTGKGRPGDRQGAASRGRCSRNVNARNLLALIPDTEMNPSVGLTVEEHPTFWFSVPYAAEDFYAIEFEILEPIEGQETLPPEQRDYNTFYQTRLMDTAFLPGIASFRLPETAPPLKPNKTYQWSVRFYCGEPQVDYPDMPLLMGGSIIRVAPTEHRVDGSDTLEHALSSTTSSRERAFVLARYGVWYDSFNEIAHLRRTGSAIADWQALLDAIELEEMVSQPLVDCCISGTSNQ
jgi:hypothetical protein